MFYILIYTLYSFIGLVFITFLILLVWLVYTIMNIFLTLREPASTISYKKPEGEQVQFYSSDGVQLWGVFLPAKTQPKGTVIFCPEVDADSDSCTKYCTFLPDAGYNVFSIDFRGHGKSSNLDGYVSRQWLSSYEVYDIKGAIEYITGRKDIDPAKIALFGVSRGAGAAINTAAEMPGIKAVITDSAFCTKRTLNAYMKKYTKIFLPVTKLFNFLYVFLENLVIKITEIKLGYKLPAVDSALKNLNCPLLLIHGQRDSYISLDQAKALFSIANEPKRFVEVSGARHNESVVVNPELYTGCVTEFLNKYLK